MKKFLLGFGACYLAIAIVAGFAMKAVLPTLNPIGIAYTGVTWPIAAGCIAVHAECTNVPPQRYASWLFTFTDDAA